MQICPYCASENIFFSKKRNKYFCEDCEKGFDSPSSAKGMRVFLSYGHDKNAPIVKRIKDHLVSIGYDVWIDTSEIPAGHDWRERITNGLMGSNGVLSFLSKHSVRDPGVCLDELKIAVCLKNAYIKTVLLEDESEVSPPSIINRKQWLDMSDWSKIPESEWNGYFENKMELLAATLNSDEASSFNRDLESISEKLAVSDNTAKQQRLLKQTFVGREWLTQAVDSWLRSDSKEPFIIFGVPGSGKSAFAANLAHFNPNVPASVFFEWDHAQLKDTNYVIKHLAFKFAATLPDYRRMLCNILDDPNVSKEMKNYSGSALFDFLILNPLLCCIDGKRERSMIVIDGLDETSVEVADLLIYKAMQLPQWLKILFTSRYDSKTESLFDETNKIFLDNSLESNRRDIAEYLALRLDLSIEDEKVQALAEKSEGSFMYAVSFCDAVENGNISMNEASALPVGLNRFYLAFFKRLFETQESYREIRPFLELLCVEEDIPEETLTEALKLDKYGLWELRLTVKSLVTSSDSTCGLGNGYKLKTIKFVHQSIKDWLTDQKLAGEFFVDVSRGYRQLARFYETDSEKKEEPDSLEPDPFYKKLQSIDKNNFTEEQLRELRKEIEAHRAKNEARVKKRIEKRAIKDYSITNYVKWLILGGEYDKAEKVLLDSFDRESKAKTFSYRNYTDYYSLFHLWQWADMFPASYPTSALSEKLKEIVLFPKSIGGVSRYFHRSSQISALTLRYIMDSGRYKEAFFEFIKDFGYAGYFTSGASDDGETRDGWDKFYLARDSAICIKKLDKAGITVPQEVRSSCEKMKLTFDYERGDPHGGCTGGYRTFLRTQELFKDVCRLDDPRYLPELLKEYNTQSLHFYLTNSDEEDLDFIKECVKYSADLSEACSNALTSIEKFIDGTDKYSVSLKNTAKRIDFISALAKTEK